MRISAIGLDGSGIVSFQSHAHTDHFASGRIIYATKPTIYLSHLRNSKLYSEVKFGKKFYIGEFKAKLYPSGHMLGSSGIKIWIDIGTIYYTGDVKFEKLRTAEEIKIPKSDFLVIEATFGIPRFRFPKPREAEKIILGIVEDALDKGKTPVFSANPYGKAQELIKILNVHGYSAKIDGEISKVSKIYSKFGIKLKVDDDGEIVVSKKHGIKVSGFGNVKLSNHADFWELLEIVEKVNPEKVFTVYGYSEQFARILRAFGYDASSLDRNVDLWEVLNSL
ncbi:mRNA 3'-end processing factor [Pyrococcus sp. NA2]|uniref:MBL fold metallo-hydrolase n=1 Tax=Pyrococcus sp. (strain NA2) TaxID=342949 RepID=UPI000209AE8D|nr:MBL fold metallo-hydrolase [Pyrococcus sp. NA2]AEC52283.1 mRNA 3'-end processing factor [Pyrococcus sp. NA2]